MINERKWKQIRWIFGNCENSATIPFIIGVQSDLFATARSNLDLEAGDVLLVDADADHVEVLRGPPDSNVPQIPLPDDVVCCSQSYTHHSFLTIVLLFPAYQLSFSEITVLIFTVIYSWTTFENSWNPTTDKWLVTNTCKHRNELENSLATLCPQYFFEWWSVFLPVTETHSFSS